jgi:hypothetical protein
MSDRGETNNVLDLKRSLVSALNRTSGVAQDILKSKEYSEKWDSKYINDLPNAAFAVIEKGYSDGKDRRARHLPHHGSGVKSATDNSSVDLSHYRNALARVNQIKSVLGEDSDSTLRKKAASHLERHRAVLQTAKSSFNPIEILIWEECEKLFVTNVKPLLFNDRSEEDTNGKI